MNWKLIALLSMFGLAMGFLTVFVIPSTIEPLVWLAIFVTCAVIIAKKAPKKHFMHGLCVSLVNCVWITSAHVIFFDTYVARHADEAQMMTSMPFAGRVMMLITGPIVGLLSGIVLGIFSFIASKVLKPSP